MRRAKNLAPSTRFGQKGQAKVGQNHLPLLVQHNIGRFDITMNDPPFMGVVEGQADLLNNLVNPVGFHQRLLAPIVSQNRPQIMPFDILHGHIEHPFGLTITIDPDNVRMI